MKHFLLFAAVGALLCAFAEERFPEPPAPATAARQEALTTYRLLQRDMKWRRIPREARDINGNTNVPYFQPPADQCVNAHAIIWDEDRDPLDVLLRRTRAHYADLTGPEAPDRPAAELLACGPALRRISEAARATAVADEEARYRLFEKTMALRRQIAFANPLVKALTKLLFITRETPPPDELTWGTHMCDQYFGFHATLKGSTHGNGIWTLTDPFGDHPKLTELTPAHKTKIASADPYWNGRRITPEGGFLSPDVSFDGREILFCWTPGAFRIREWDEQTTFHIMKMNADGSNLTLLTSGGVNDLFPCWLPSGRILFCSERRGGYGRCHMREVPNFTLHSMFPDGTDIVCLSPHETNEWEPSVDNDGMVVYTRWDYVDRGFNQAHHAWITYPDGRDPRELNGNTRINQRLAPHMTQAIRAIPGSRRYVAVSVGHHTPDRGSLVLIDPSVPDDNLTSQVKRLTPEVLLPEAEKMISWPLRPTGCYGTPWPLSEKYYLCTYDGDGNGQYTREIDYQRRKYALTLLDCFGNKITVYRHPTISCSDPMPLMARRMPPVIPHKTLFGRPVGPDGRKPAAIPESEMPQKAVLGLVNVYNSRYAFPAGAKVKALRVWQLFPKIEPLDGHPRLGVIDQMPGRQCLGTVRVEEDGSAQFYVPVKTPVYFQALDEDGCAIQSMRTVTYGQSGERLTCNGCHESRHGRAGTPPKATPLAFRRPPDDLVPEPEGSKPFNYPRLVQPVLDAKCVSCHGAKRDERTMPDLRRGDIYFNPYCFHTSFIDLVGRGLVQYYTQFYCGTNWCDVGVQRDRFVQAYSEPGRVGARASRLYAILKAGHHGVKLTDAEMRRIVVFLDSHGAYISHDGDAMAQCEGRVVEGVNFPPARAVPVAGDEKVLVVGDDLAALAAGAAACRRGRFGGLVVATGALTGEKRALAQACGIVFDEAELLRVVKGRCGFVTGVEVRLKDGRVVQVRGQVVLDGTPDGRVCAETGAERVDGHFLPGPDFLYPYLPKGSRNVFVTTKMAGLPRDEAAKLADPEVQRRLGGILAGEIVELAKGVNSIFTQRGR